MAREDIREVKRREMAKLSVESRDIFPIPPVKNKKRRNKALKDLEYFCKTYFPNIFYLPWGQIQKKIKDRISVSTDKGSVELFIVPRGSGKTTIAECGILHSILSGKSKFAVLIGSEEESAKQCLESIRVALETNELLLEDFPEVCWPFWRLEGIARRAPSQLYQGERTHIKLGKNAIVFATVPGSKVSGSRIAVAGITGRIRGMKFNTVDGRVLRPDLFLADDPQTDESAHSLVQTQTRFQNFTGAVKGMAGPGKKIAGLVCATCICPGDLTHKFIDLYGGEKEKLLPKMPTNMALWDEYGEIFDRCRKSESRDISEATKFYKKHQKKMDEGAEVSWEERYNEDEISAIQNAMNLYYENKAVFLAEYQNDPLMNLEGDQLLTIDDLRKKLNGYDRNEIPLSGEKLTAFIDVHANILYYIVVCFKNDFTGYIIDYGTYPEQPFPYFTMSSLKRKLEDFHPGGLEERIFSALEHLTDSILSQEYEREDGAIFRVSKCLIDAGWGEVCDTIYQFCRKSKYSSNILPSHGRGVTASSIPFSEYKKSRGDVVGHNWRIPAVFKKRIVRHVIFDANYWKSFVESRWLVGLGGTGSLSVFGRNNEELNPFFEHCLSEYKIKTAGRGRIVFEWKARPDRENHWLDCLVGAHVAASIESCRLLEFKDERQKRVPMSLASLQNQMRTGNSFEKKGLSLKELQEQKRRKG